MNPALRGAEVNFAAQVSGGQSVDQHAAAFVRFVDHVPDSIDGSGLRPPFDLHIASLELRQRCLQDMFGSRSGSVRNNEDLTLH